MRYSDFSTISLQLCSILVIILVGFGIWLASRLSHITCQLGDIKIKSHHNGVRTVRDLFALAHIHHIRILTTKSRFSDCYDTQQKTIYLSPETAAHSTITAIGIVAHEVGHVLQDKNHFWLLNAVVNVARLNRLAGNLTIPALLTGFFLDLTLLILFGYCLFFICAICNILIYYLNSDASKRGEAWLRRGKLISKEEDKLVRKFLTSANMSYLGGIVIAPFEVFFTFGRMLSKLTFSRSKEEALRPRSARKS